FRLWTSHHVVPGRWVAESNAGPAGEALDWIGRLLAPDAPVPAARVLAEAAGEPPGARGFRSTLGAQIANARALALPVGALDLCHLATEGEAGRAALARAVVEGMAFALRANVEQLESITGASGSPVHGTGGISRSAVWNQMAADVLDRPVRVGPQPEATGLGAAICAGVAARVFESLEAGARALAEPRETRAPDAGAAAAYVGVYESWRALGAAREPASGLVFQAALPGVMARAGEAAAPSAAGARPRMLVTASLDDEALEALRALGDVEYAPFRERMRLLTGDSLVEALAGVQVFVTEVDVVDARSMAALPDLRVVASCRGDAVNVDVEAATALGIPVLNAPGRNADAVADLTVAYLLMLARKLAEANAFLRDPGVAEGDMGKMGQAFQTLRGRELWRKTVGLVGLGAVGRGVARRLAGFGARVLVFDPFLPPEAVIRAGAEPATLDALLAESDFVSLHAPVTPETEGMIGAAELARMKDGACLLNSARAALVDEAALLDALASGRLGGVATDVFSVEPPGHDHPLLAFPNVVATPHVGGNTVEVAAHQGAIIAGDLARLLAGGRPRFALNPDVCDGFTLDRARPALSPERLDALASRPGPAVTDLQKKKDARPRTRADATPPTDAAPAAAAPAGQAPAEVVDAMGRIVEGFVAGITGDAALAAFSKGKDVTLHFQVTDLPVEFHFRLDDGTVSGAAAAPAERPEVELRMRANVLDGMFTGRVNPMQEAMSGGISFSGDTAKAMTIQQIQADLSRLWAEARAAVGDPGDLASLPDPAGAAAPAAAGDVRHEIVSAVEELYGQELITATGGNVSARVPGTENEIWITPSQLFKGDLRPELLVRIDLDGERLEGNLSPSSEWMMHCAVYKAKPEAQAVVHAHAPHATILANADLPFLPVSTEAAFFSDIPRVPFIMPGTHELADAITAALGDGWAVLMKNHGLMMGGRSLRRAADMVEIVDRSAQVMLGCWAVGKEPPSLPEDVVRTLRAMGDLVA
ncbi:MAG TPA: NAD(P)-dependent oxidoreductase, partial [Myxococcota bacterium]|nr:NAD(P)-dependent oxidoreductase [Myxococcota bacterium]